MTIASARQLPHWFSRPVVFYRNTQKCPETESKSLCTIFLGLVDATNNNYLHHHNCSHVVYNHYCYQVVYQKSHQFHSHQVGIEQIEEMLAKF